MKRCPSCGELNDDKVLRCWQCREWFDEITTPRLAAKKAAGKKGKAGSANWQTRLNEIWRENVAAIMVTVILLFLVFYTVLQQRPEENNKTGKINQTAAEKAEVNPSFSNPVLPDPSPAVLEQHAALKTESAAAGSAYELFNKAQDLCSSGKCTDTQKAIEYLDEAIRLKPNYSGAYNNRGNAYCNLGQYKRAIEDYNEAVRIKPDYAIAFGNRGGAYDNLGQHARAIEDYNQAISLKPDYINAYINRGNVYLSEGTKDLGCADVREACELGNCTALEAARKKKLCE
jgi:tetratricopeptide (TPR) repeat protein